MDTVPEFGTLVAIKEEEDSVWMVLGGVDFDFSFIDDQDDEHDYRGGQHVALIRLVGESRWSPGLTMGMTKENIEPLVRDGV